MKIIKTVEEARRVLKQERSLGRAIGLVPTMGYFHEGHLALIREARKACDVVVVSIFVNPIQFGPSEDFHSYPRDLIRDSQLAQEEEVDYLFLPTKEELYPSDYLTCIEVEKITKKLCGAKRPNHFNGVATVVAKLFNITNPDKAFFGEKDAQQLLVIKKIVADLNFDIEIVGVPTVRESGGLAMSSRNTYLNSKEKRAACVLSRSLSLACDLIDAGEKDAEKIKSAMVDIIKKESLVNLEYLSVCDTNNLEEISQISGKILIALAAKVGKARLIDSVFISPEN